MRRVLALLSVVVSLCGGQKWGEETSLGVKGEGGLTLTVHACMFCSMVIQAHVSFSILTLMS